MNPELGKSINAGIVKLAPLIDMCHPLQHGDVVQPRCRIRRWRSVTGTTVAA